MRETTDEWKVRTISGGTAGFCDIGSIDTDVIQDLVEEFWPDGGEQMWQSMARNQYLSIWNDPKNGAATRQSDLATGGTEEERPCMGTDGKEVLEPNASMLMLVFNTDPFEFLKRC